MKDYRNLCLLSKLPLEAVWMLAVDGKFYQSQNGPAGYELREKNSVNRLIMAISSLLGADKITASTLLATHTRCMQGIIAQNRLGVCRNETNAVGYQIFPEWITPAGLEAFSTRENKDGTLLVADSLQLKATGQIGTFKAVWAAIQAGQLSMDKVSLAVNPKKRANSTTISKLTKFECGLMYQPPCHNHMKESIQMILDHYYDHLAHCVEHHEKLSLIIQTIQNLTRLHPFFDGNNRIFVNGLLNAFLLENGFDAAILYDPNIFEFYAVSELVAIIEKAMADTKQFIESPEKVIYEFNLATLSPDVVQPHLVFSKMFMQRITQLLIEEAKIGIEEGYYVHVLDYLEAIQNLNQQLAAPNLDVAKTYIQLITKLQDTIQELTTDQQELILQCREKVVDIAKTLTEEANLEIMRNLPVQRSAARHGI